MIYAIVAVALGVMVGVALIQPLGKPIRQLPLRTERVLGMAIGKAMVALKNASDAARRNVTARKQTHRPAEFSGRRSSSADEFGNRTWYLCVMEQRGRSRFSRTMERYRT